MAVHNVITERQRGPELRKIKGDYGYFEAVRLSKDPTVFVRFADFARELMHGKIHPAELQRVGHLLHTVDADLLRWLFVMAANTSSTKHVMDRTGMGRTAP